MFIVPINNLHVFQITVTVEAILKRTKKLGI